MSAVHIPVMAEEVRHYLDLEKNGVYLDATFGSGGHTKIIAEGQNTQIVAIDRDSSALHNTRSIKDNLQNRFHFYTARFSQIGKVWEKDLGELLFDAVVFDLGVSSLQIDNPQRGFSFMQDAKLDMRMQQNGFKASDVLNTLDEHELAQIFAIYGEEKHAKKIAKAILQQRKITPFETTAQLAQLCAQNIYRPRQRARQKIHPATRVFQALRIFVNDELRQIITGLMKAEKILKPGGKLIVISFHSLEDRIVKNFFRFAQGRWPLVPKGFDQQKNILPSLEINTKKPILPTAQEIAINQRARSAKMRVASRTKEKSTADEKKITLFLPKLTIFEKNMRYLNKII